MNVTTTPPDGGPPRLLYVVSEDRPFLQQRLPMARAARDAGFEVHVATRVRNGGDRIVAERFKLHEVPFERGRLAPWATVKTIFSLRRLQRTIRPAIVHNVSVQATVIGLVAARRLPSAYVNTLTGLGYVFTSNAPKARLVRPVLRALLARLLNRDRTTTLVENPDDRNALIAFGVAPDRVALFPGSGVDAQHLQPLPEPRSPITIGFVGRLLDDKGIRSLIAAHRLVRARGQDIRLLIAGSPDPANPASVSLDEAAAWNGEPGITWLGHVTDIAGFWARAHIAVLPSRREGLPISLLEAAACGRPMIATDVPGCREIAVEGETAILVPVDDPPALADAIERLSSSPELRSRLGSAARKRVAEQFSADIVGSKIVAIYRQLFDETSHEANIR